MNRKEIINELWNIYDDLGKRFGYLEVLELGEIIAIMENEL